jgi:hypothetical protein
VKSARLLWREMRLGFLVLLFGSQA